jgi:hypothetical protein
MSRADSQLKDRVAFLVGVRRSGTNWLRRIVDAHPDAAVIPGETYLLSHGIRPLQERVQHGLRGSARTGTIFVDADRFKDAARTLCDDLLLGHLDGLDDPVRVLGERTPDHVRNLDLVRDIYPDAAVVHIIRDGRDVARSLVSQPWGPQTYREAAEEWVSGIESAREVAPELDRYLEVGYERLLEDPGRCVPELYDFLGLSTDGDVVERALLEAGVPYNVDPAVNRVTTQKWRGGIVGDDLAEVLDVAGPMLDALGYDTAGPEPARPGITPAPAERVGHLLRDLRRQAPTSVPELRALLRRNRPSTFEREVLDALDTTMGVLDDLLADIAERRFDHLDRHFTPKARIRVVGAGGSWDQRGAPAVRRLADELAADIALAGHQVRGDVHPAVPTFTVVSTWETSDGVHHDRVLVVGRFGNRIDELTWYRLPRLP